MDVHLQNFVEQFLCSTDKVDGIIFFGSRTRADYHDTSDYDLLILRDTPTYRSIEKVGEHSFELLHTCIIDALKYWKAHPHGAATLWETGQILYDPIGNVQMLKEEICTFLNKNMPSLSIEERYLRSQDLTSLLSNAASQYALRESSGEFLLQHCLFEIIQDIFLLKKTWIPGPKQRLKKLEEICPEHIQTIRNCITSLPFQTRLELCQSLVKDLYLSTAQ